MWKRRVKRGAFVGTVVVLASMVCMAARLDAAALERLRGGVEIEIRHADAHVIDSGGARRRGRRTRRSASTTSSPTGEHQEVHSCTNP